MLPEVQRPGIGELQRHCIETRLGVLDEMDVAGSGHLGPAFSVVEILVTLYYSYLAVRPDEPHWAGRDRFILSKGHACSALYPILADLGFFDHEHLTTFTRLGSILGDHPDMRKIPGVDFSSGSLGHGLSIGAGMAEALRLAGADSKVAVLLGDGELNEGQVWEAAAYAAHRRLSRLLGIVDVNAVCVDGSTTEVLEFEPIEKKWAAFGWRTQRLPGHDIGALRDALDGFDRYVEAGGAQPTVLIADTVAGRGISFIEGMAEWHVGYLAPLDRARAVHDIETMFEAHEAVSA
jgi:transketolase